MLKSYETNIKVPFNVGSNPFVFYIEAILLILSFIF